MILSETFASGAPNPCPRCKTEMKLQVLESNAGFYIGTQCKCGPYSRETGYYEKREQAQGDLDNGTFTLRLI